MLDMEKIEKGSKAPAFALKNQDGKVVKLSDFKGSKAVIYFYPKDDTPGCTTEACQFQNNLREFSKLNVPVVGISPDSAESHQKFIEKYKLKFQLLSDPDHNVMESYGAWGEKMLYGKKSVGTIRSTFLIDEKGTVLKAWYKVKADGHAQAVLAELAKY
jgi:peroxiredoxin Q/BCP